ncbi:MAG: 50S ribosomal protein L19e [Candidatus Aenigmarchaeota archaeon]|nr:50S ribosomal protein L19e [Candidatus Aenigmarchaeota archaeon]
MDLKYQKRIAAMLLKAGRSRVRLAHDKEVDEAITREDVRKLIKKGLITKEYKKGTSRWHANRLLKQKKKSLRKGAGSRKGKSGSRKGKKDVWIRKIRALRKLLKGLLDSDMIEKPVYKKMYMMAKGNAFRNKRHMIFYLKENNLMRKPSKGDLKVRG